MPPLLRFLLFFALALPSLRASPIPLATDFSEKFDAFFAPSGNGYRWGHDWRTEHYQNWVTAANRTVTASVRAPQLAGKASLIRVSVDPVTLGGAQDSIGLAASGSQLEFNGDVYLAEVKPRSNRIRLTRGSRTLISERDLNELDLTDLEPFEMTFIRRAAPVASLTFTIRKGDQEETFTANDIAPLTGAYFGLRNRNTSGRFEVHYDSLEIRSPDNAAFHSNPPERAVVGEPYLYAPTAAGLIEAFEFPDWLTWDRGRLEGTPGLEDAGDFQVRLRSTGLADSSDKQTFTITVLNEALARPMVSVDRGFFDQPLVVEISPPLAGSTLIYTLDGSTPSPENGTAVDSPVSVPILQTTVLRARAMKDGFGRSPVATHTYLFLDDIKNQQADGQAPAGWPGRTTNGQTFNFGMDPEITRSLTDEAFHRAMTDIPSVSLVTDLENLVDPDKGIWVNAEDRGREAERPVSLEWLDATGKDMLQIDAGVRIRGGWSRRGVNPKHAFHLYFRKVYGESKLRHPLFGDEGVDTFDRLDLRATQGRSWHFSDSADATFNRDVFGRHVQRDMGQPYARSRYYHVYLNGIYFGLFQSQERPDKNYAADYFGGEPEDYDVIKTRTRPHRVEVLDGDANAWTQLFDAATEGFASDEAYRAIQGLDGRSPNLIDVDNL
ncbi:MAG: CotH kinase family protein, partial [Verrucomicrobiota bacterium]